MLSSVNVHVWERDVLMYGKFECLNIYFESKIVPLAVDQWYNKLLIHLLFIQASRLGHHNPKSKPAGRAAGSTTE